VPLAHYLEHLGFGSCAKSCTIYTIWTLSLCNLHIIYNIWVSAPVRISHSLQHLGCWFGAVLAHYLQPLDSLSLCNLHIIYNIWVSAPVRISHSLQHLGCWFDAVLAHYLQHLVLCTCAWGLLFDKLPFCHLLLHGGHLTSCPFATSYYMGGYLTSCPFATSYYMGGIGQVGHLPPPITWGGI